MPKEQNPRFPPNFIRPPLFFRFLDWIDRLVDFVLGRPILLSNAKTLKEFDAGTALLAQSDTLRECFGDMEMQKVLRDELDVLSRALDEHKAFSATGRMLFRGVLVGYLERRRQVFEFCLPEQERLRGLKLRQPILIIGLPRTGSTLLQRLMSLDKNARSTFKFESDNPIPPRTTRESQFNDPRIHTLDSSTAQIELVLPDVLRVFNESHEMAASDIEENFTVTVCHCGFQSLLGFSFPWPVERYLNDNEYGRAQLQYERGMLLMMQAYLPPASHWILKSPMYILWVEALMDIYSDAKFVVTHRNPLTVVPSACKLFEKFTLPFFRDFRYDKFTQADLVDRIWRKGTEDLMRYRRAHPERASSIMDVDYSELFSNPIETVKKIYKQFNLEYTEEFEQAMQQFLAEHQQSQFVRHRYTLEEFGLNRTSMAQHWSEYMTQYHFSADAVVCNKPAD